MPWQVVVTNTAQQQLASVTDARVRELLKKRLLGLGEDPDKQGKALTGELAGYRSIRAVGQRYRILYKLRSGVVTVYVVAIGIRKEGSKADIYELARRLLRLGLLEPDQNP